MATELPPDIRDAQAEWETSGHAWSPPDPRLAEACALGRKRPG